MQLEHQVWLHHIFAMARGRTKSTEKLAIWLSHSKLSPSRDVTTELSTVLIISRSVTPGIPPSLKQVSEF